MPIVLLCLLITESFYGAQIACLYCTASKLEGNNYPMFLCAVRLCIWLHWFVYNMSVYTCIFSKKLAFSGLSTWKLPVRVIYCLLIEFNHAKMSLLHQVIQSCSERNSASINGRGGRFWKLYCSSYVHTIFQCIRCTYIQCRVLLLWLQLLYNTTAAPSQCAQGMFFWNCSNHDGSSQQYGNSIEIVIWAGENHYRSICTYVLWCTVSSSHHT